uniref:Anaphase-promoting complex subunit 4 n=1 Tax=Kwoniella dejecticola CBS 10117 TaxID=1296121 RepID=A0A1A5ZYS1_9TREE|nr:uncharacterized protein I303_06513 [Kwoniella dejecticola CBS 10117]OBR82955.1 hypothetical protein I303_06513 [Kwoniella dejecticola CBS 10117]
MIFPDRTSFTPLSTISLPSSYVLRPGSCNPSMDLVVLLSPPINSTVNAAASTWKGKGKEVGKTQVSLWRTGGSKVWEVSLRGQVVGLAWSEDGLILSLFAWTATERRIDHLSVHTGEIIRSVPFPQHLSVGEIEDLRDGRWVDMKWSQASHDWDPVKDGSAIGIIDSLPTVTPVAPPKPPNLLPFMQKSNKPEPKPTLHPLLSAFPSLLPSRIPLPPNILRISSYPFLTGTLPLPLLNDNKDGKPHRTILELSKVSDRMVGFLDIILRGLENAVVAFRESEKQTMICREDLETCAQQQAMSIPDVHSDLFRFLMTGRSGVAVNEWLGSKLTGRTVTKWDQTLDSSYRTIQNLIIESISPAVERLVLLLEEMRGWSRTSVGYQAQLNLQEQEISSAIDLVLGFGKLMEKMRRDAEHEMKAAAEFMKWLKYDTSSDDLPNPTHDLKLVWSFMINGFVHSSFHSHFPYLPVRPPKDFLADDYLRYPRRFTKGLEDVVKETQAELGIGKKEITYTPSTRANESLDSENTSTMSMDMSMSLAHEGNEDQDIDLDAEDDEDDGDLTPTGISSDEDDEEEELPSSPDTVAKKDPYALSEEEEVQRVIEKEPWVWANTLVRDLEKLIKIAIGESEAGENVALNDGLRDKREVADGAWDVAVMKNVENTQQVWLMYTARPGSSSSRSAVASFALGDAEQSSTCLAVQIFDDEEVVLLLESEDGRYLCTIRYADLLEGGHLSELPDLPREWTWEEVVKGYQNAFESTPPIPIARSRYLGATPQFDAPGGSVKASIALNGRSGRRLGCIAYEDGRSVQVWDLDIDEDEDEDGDGDEDEEGLHVDED